MGEFSGVLFSPRVTGQLGGAQLGFIWVFLLQPMDRNPKEHFGQVYHCLTLGVFQVRPELEAVQALLLWLTELLQDRPRHFRPPAVARGG